MLHLLILTLFHARQSSGDTLPTLSLSFMESQLSLFPPSPSPSSLSPSSSPSHPSLSSSTLPSLLRSFFLNATITASEKRRLTNKSPKSPLSWSPPKYRGSHLHRQQKVPDELPKENDIHNIGYGEGNAGDDGDNDLHYSRENNYGEDNNIQKAKLNSETTFVISINSPDTFSNENGSLNKPGEEGDNDYGYHDLEGDGDGENDNAAETMKPQIPYLDSINSSTRVFLGSVATLNCTVYDLNNESVSWLRLVDDVLELLTWGSQTYTTDERYSLVQESSENWQRWKLMIKNVRVNDQGQYRCQVSTHPPLLKNVTLVITEPVVRIVDERGTDVVDKHYRSGSMIELKCIIEKVPFPHGFVTWRRGSLPLTFTSSRGGISVRGNEVSGYIRSRLYVANANPEDAGVYSCWYDNYTSDFVTIHVIAGENSQAMHHDVLPETATNSGGSSSHCSRGLSNWITLLLAMFFTFTTSDPVNTIVFKLFRYGHYLCFTNISYLFTILVRFLTPIIDLSKSVFVINGGCRRLR